MTLLDEPLHIFRDGSSPHDGAGHNRALDTFLEESRVGSHQEQGSVVVMKTSSVHNPVYVDMTSSDIEHVREFFLYETNVSPAVERSTA